MGKISLSQLKQDFDLQSNDLDVLRDSLNLIRIELHPDKNNGIFKNQPEEERYHKISEAIEFIESLKSNTSLMVVEQMTDLVKAIAMLVPNNKESSFQTNVETKINFAIANYKSKLFLPKISLTVVAAVMTFLFALPSQLKDNPALSKYLNVQSSSFIVIWLMMLLYTGFFWLMAYTNEERGKRKLSLLKVDSTQNEIFDEFIKLNDKSSFTKDELTEYIFHRYSRANTSVLLFGSEAVTKEVAQSISELILARAEKKGILQVSNENSLSDKFLLKMYS
jgi:hypothetical protein